MNILQSWSHSLTIFKPSSLKLFLLVTLKSIIETYKLLFTTFWWAVCMFVIADVVSFVNFNPQTATWHKVLSLLFLSLIHISEPTRRTPISYAVFCLKK